MANLVSANQLAGLPIHYDRFRPEDYGKSGHPHNVYMTTKLQAAMESCIGELLDVAPKEFGVARFLLTGGAYVQKPGYHGLGRAFDLDALLWDNQQWIANSFPDDPHLYLAIESIIRRHFGTVLTHSYNQPHEDHIHIDDGTSVAFSRMSKSRVIYLQNVIHFVYGIQISRDGVWGPQTESSEKMVRSELGLGSLSNKQNWLAFLLETAHRAFMTSVNRELFTFASAPSLQITYDKIWSNLSAALTAYDAGFETAGLSDKISDFVHGSLKPTPIFIAAVREYPPFKKNGIDFLSGDFNKNFRDSLYLELKGAKAFLHVVETIGRIYVHRGWDVKNG